MKTTRALVLLVALLAAALGSLVLSAPASAARTVDVVLGDRAPTAVALQPGDSVRFVNGETSPLSPHRVTSTVSEGSTPWEYDSGSLGPGQATEPVVFASAGTYVFVDRRGGPGPLGQDQSGRIAVTAPPPPAAPPAQQQSAPPPAAPPAAPPPAAPPAAPAAPPADVPAGSGSAALPGLVGSADLGALQAPVGEGAVVPPAIAELLAAGQPDVAAPPLPPVQAVAGPLPGAGTSRPLGLPATLAVLAAAGVASLLVRVLLAEPAAAPGRGFASVQLRTAG